MDAGTEREMSVREAMDVDAVGVVELLGVVVGSTPQQQHTVVGGHVLAAKGRVLRQCSGKAEDGRIEAQELLDGVREQVRVRGQFTAQLRMLGQVGERVADGVGGRLGTRAEQQDCKPEDLPFAHRLAVDHTICDEAEQVVGRNFTTLCEHAGQIASHLQDRVHCAVLVGERDDVLDLVAELLPPFVGDAEQAADDDHRHRNGELFREVRRAAVGESVDQVSGDASEPRLHRLDSCG